MIKKLLKRIFPSGTKRFAFIKRLAVTLHLARPVPFEPDYERWMKHIEPETFLPVLKPDEQKILFSIVIPFYNTPAKYLTPLLDSIRSQSYQNWELIIADASTDDERVEAIKEASQRDARFKYHKVKKNGGISANTNFALDKAVGEYVVFSDHDDTLSPHALNEAATQLLNDSKIDIIYSDEDKLSDNGKWRHSPFFKPDWSPHLFLNTNYTNHLSVIRRKLVEGVGGLRPEFDGSQDYDLLLRIHRKFGPLNVSHIDKVLYHWREAAGSTAVSHNSKSYAFEAGRKALQEYVDAGPVPGEVMNIDMRPGFYNHKFTPAFVTSATICVGVASDKEKNQRFLEKLHEITDTNVVSATFIAVDPGISSTRLKELSNGTDAVFIFRTTAMPCESDWLTRLCGVLELPDVACVSPRILNADLGRVVDMGKVDDGNGTLLPLLKGLAASDQTYIGHAEWVRDVDELSGAVEGYLRTKPAGAAAQRYSVVWSYANFRNQHILRAARFFNGNLYTSPKNKVRINGEQ